MTDRKSVDLANRLWSLCNVLRDDGIVFHKYVSELTYLLFLKNAAQVGAESNLPIGCRWDDLYTADARGILSVYRKMLTRLGEDSHDPTVRRIFSFPTTVFSHDESLARVVEGIEALDWHAYDRDTLGDAYESLLERNANEARSGSGQYFTPRSLVDALVKVTKPTEGELIVDPAAGTGGFLIAAHRASETYGNSRQTYASLEIERDTARLGLMNSYLHGLTGQFETGDALTEDSKFLTTADVVLANPPFGSVSHSLRPRRPDLRYPTASKHLSFLDLIMRLTSGGGRAAVVVPDSTLDDPGIAELVRRELLAEFNLHTVLRLPPGIFYAQGVLTHVLFFGRDGRTPEASSGVWTYDLRTGMPGFNKKRRLSEADLADFVQSYGTDAMGRSSRAASSRFSYSNMREIRENNYRLFVSSRQRNAPTDIADAGEIILRLEETLEETQSLLQEMSALLSGISKVSGKPHEEQVHGF